MVNNAKAYFPVWEKTDENVDLYPKTVKNFRSFGALFNNNKKNDS